MTGVFCARKNELPGGGLSMKAARCEGNRGLTGLVRSGQSSARRRHCGSEPSVRLNKSGAEGAARFPSDKEPVPPCSFSPSASIHDTSVALEPCSVSAQQAKSLPSHMSHLHKGKLAAAATATAAALFPTCQDPEEPGGGCPHFRAVVSCVPMACQHPPSSLLASSASL